jgi:hypothetical protein
MLAEIHPTNIISPKWIDTYYSEREAIGKELTRLNSNLFVMEKIMSYPFSLLREVAPHITYWGLTIDGMGDSCVLILWKLALDSGGEHNGKKSLTLKKFRSGVMQNLHPHLSDEIKDELTKNLKDIDFDKCFNTYKDRVVALRNERIAHFDYDRNTGSVLSAQSLQITLAELKDLATTACSLFGELCFGFKQHLYFGGYGSSLAQKEQTDIDVLLNFWAKNSEVLNMPEDQSWLWVDVYRGQFSDDEMKTFNTWRRRIGKPEVA